MFNYFDRNTYAEQPGNVRLSGSKLQAFKSELPFLHRFFGKGLTPTGYFRQHLKIAAANPAVVVQVEPRFLVAAYSSDLDAVAMLEFSPRVKRTFAAAVGDRLLSINSYTRSVNSNGEIVTLIAPDLLQGPRASGNGWSNFWPVIADFVARDLEPVKLGKQYLPDHEWERVIELGPDYLRRYGNFWRMGNPYLSEIPARVRD